MADITYSLGTTGSETVLSDAEKLEKAIVGSARNSARGVDETKSSTDKLADSFKMVSRDIGTVGGQAAQTFTHMADEALSVVSAVGKGGIVGAIALAGTAFGALATAISDVKKEREEARKAAVAAEKEERDEIKSTVDEMMGKHAALTTEKVLRQDAEIAIRRQAKAELEDLIAQQEKLKSDADSPEQAIRTMMTLRINQSKLNKDQAELDVLVEQNALDKKKLAHKEANEAEAAAGKEAADAFDKRNALRLAKQNAFNAEQRAILKHAAELEAQDRAEEIERQNQFNAIERQKLKEDREAQIAEEKADFEDREKLEKFKIKEAEDDKKKAEAKDREAKAIEHANVALAQQTVELEKVRKAEEKAAQSALIMAASNEVMGASSMVISAAMGPVLDKLSSLKDLNRENAKELFQFSEDAPAQYMKIAQGVLVGIGVQAAGQAVAKMAEGIGNIGTGAALVATGINAAQGTAMIQAGGVNLASAAMYAGLAGISLGAGASLGLARPLTNDEKNKGKESDASTSAGSSAGRNTGSSGDGGNAGPVVVNYNVMFGGTASEDRRAAQRVNRYVARGRNDAFARTGS